MPTNESRNSPKSDAPPHHTHETVKCGMGGWMMRTGNAHLRKPDVERRNRRCAPKERRVLTSEQTPLTGKLVSKRKTLWLVFPACVCASDSQTKQQENHRTAPAAWRQRWRVVDFHLTHRPLRPFTTTASRIALRSRTPRTCTPGIRHKFTRYIQFIVLHLDSSNSARAATA